MSIFQMQETYNDIQCTTRFLTRVTRRMLLVEKKLPTLRKHLPSSRFLFCGVRVATFLIFSVVFRPSANFS
jgi:hypothetical protein